METTGSHSGGWYRPFCGVRAETGLFRWDSGDLAEDVIHATIFNVSVIT